MSYVEEYRAAQSSMLDDFIQKVRTDLQMLFVHAPDLSMDAVASELDALMDEEFVTTTVHSVSTEDSETW